MAGGVAGRLAATALLVLVASGPAASQSPPTPTVPGYAPVDWKVLADWVYEDPGIGGIEDASAESLKRRHQQLPAEVRALGGKKVSVAGFAVPAETDEEGRITSLMLLGRNELDCAFGHYPGMNEWILVELRQPDLVELEPYEPMRAFGRMDVGEEVEDRTVISLYRLAADRIEPVR